MSQKLWVQHKTTEKTFVDLVSTEGCTYVADFLKKIKKDTQLAIPSDSAITLYKLDDTQIKPRDIIKSLGSAGGAVNAPLVVKTIPVSCGKYLDAIAKRLSEFYEFGYSYKSGATIGDVLEAKDGVEGEDWKIREALKTQHQIDDDGYMVEIRKGQPLTKDKLPDIYTKDEWNTISEVNRKTTERVHDGQLPHLPNGKPYIIIPHSEFTGGMVSFFKNIGVKATLFSSPDDLEVKDEGLLSESSFVVE